MLVPFFTSCKASDCVFLLVESCNEHQIMWVFIWCIVSSMSCYSSFYVLPSPFMPLISCGLSTKEKSCLLSIYWTADSSNSIISINFQITSFLVSSNTFHGRIFKNLFVDTIPLSLLSVERIAFLANYHRYYFALDFWCCNGANEL